MTCPYRFYLKHVLRLAGLDDRADELDALEFGNLIHDAVAEMARSEVRNSANAAELQTFLFRALDQRIARGYGKDRVPAVDVQVHQCKLRLAALAEWQAARPADGWEIQKAETKAEFELQVDTSRSITVVGRVDRIDHNRHTGLYQVIDFKTSNAAKKPADAHRKRDGQWLDLQLPLYRHLVAGMGISGPLEFGYVVMPKDLSQVSWLPLEWGAAEFEAADTKIIEVARGILDQQFWPPDDTAARLFEEFSYICDDGVFGRQTPDEEPVG